MALVLFNSIVAGYPIPGLGLLLGFACRQGKGEAAPFAHLAFGVPGENTSTEWLEPVTDEEYDKLSK